MKLFLLMTAMLLASCGNITKEIKSEPVIIDTSCKWANPILISKSDTLTDGTAQQILAHNRKYDRICPLTK